MKRHISMISSQETLVDTELTQNLISTQNSKQSKPTVITSTKTEDQIETNFTQVIGIRIDRKGLRLKEPYL